MTDGPRVTLDGHPLELSRGDAGWQVDDVASLSDGRRVRIQVTVVPISGAPYDLGARVGLADDALLDALSTRPFVRVEINKGGVGLGLAVQLEGRLRAVVKPTQVSPHSNPRHEVAAFRIARALGLANVPSTAVRMVTRDELLAAVPPELDFLARRITAETVFDGARTLSAVMAWAPDTVPLDVSSLEAVRRRSAWLGQGGALPDDLRGLAAELSSMIVFDVLINNGDRMTGGNVLTTADGLGTVWIDHGFAFGVAMRTRAAAQLRRCQRFSRRTITALRALDVTRLDVGELLDAPDLAAMDERRRHVLEAVDALVAIHGESAVIALP